MSKKNRIQINLEYAAACVLIYGLGKLPRALAVKTGCLLGSVAYRFGRRRRLTGKRNLALALPEVDERERERILRESFVNLGRQLGEFSQFSKWSPEDLRKIVDCEGLENLETARAEERGVILVTGHLGLWEFSSFALSAFGFPLSFLVRRIDNPKVEQIIDNVRTRFGNRTINKNSAARKMLKLLKSGGVLGILMDVNTTAGEGIFVDFFGVPAATTFIMAKLALRTGAQVLPVFAVWDETARRVRLKIEPFLSFKKTGDEAEDIRRLTAAATGVLENGIRHYPGQWLWIHKRWRTRPAGEPDIYHS
jgi:KDO2-lipid IV(A) lauroyltransferase